LIITYQKIVPTPVDSLMNISILLVRIIFAIH